MTEPSKAQLVSALRRADAAGDKDAAQAIARKIKGLDADTIPASNKSPPAISGETHYVNEAGETRPRTELKGSAASAYKPSIPTKLSRAFSSPMARQTFASSMMNSLTLGGADALASGLSSAARSQMNPMHQQDYSREAFKKARLEEREKHPGMALAGDIAGFVGPGAVALKGLSTAGKAIPKATGAISSRAQTLGGWAALGGAENALYEATIGESNRSGEGQKGALEAAVSGATDPVALAAGPVLGVAGRAVGKHLGLVDEILPETIGPESYLETVKTLGGNSRDARQAAPVIGRILELANIPREDIDRAFATINSRQNEGVGSSSIPTRFKDQIIDELGEPAEGAINAFLKDAQNKGYSQGASFIRGATKEDNTRIREFVKRAGEVRLNAANRADIKQQSVDEMNRLGSEVYEPIIENGAKSEEAAESIRGLVYSASGEINGRFKSLMADLSDDFEREGISPERFIQDNPVKAAHWMQSKARELADSRASLNAKGKIAPDRRLSKLRTELLTAIEDAVPNYKEARKLYGDEAGNVAALSFARNLRSSAGDSVKIDDLAREYSGLSENQKQTARANIVELVTGVLNKNKTDGDAGAFTTIKGDDFGNALEKIFGQDGRDFAIDIKSAFERHQRIQRMNVGSSTASNLEAAKVFEQVTSGPIARFLGNTGSFILDASAVPYSTDARRNVRARFRGAKKPGNRKAGDATVKTLMRDVTQPLAPMPMPPTPSSRVPALANRVQEEAKPRPKPQAVSSRAPAPKLVSRIKDDLSKTGSLERNTLDSQSQLAAEIVNTAAIRSGESNALDFYNRQVGGIKRMGKESGPDVLKQTDGTAIYSEAQIAQHEKFNDTIDETLAQSDTDFLIPEELDKLRDKLEDDLDSFASKEEEDIYNRAFVEQEKFEQSKSAEIERKYELSGDEAAYNKAYEDLDTESEKFFDKYIAENQAALEKSLSKRRLDGELNIEAKAAQIETQGKEQAKAYREQEITSRVDDFERSHGAKALLETNYDLWAEYDTKKQSRLVMDEESGLLLPIEEFLYQRKKGAFDTRTKEILLSESADASTFMHEMAHWYLDFSAKNSDQNDFFKNQLDEVLEWHGTKKADMFDQRGKLTQKGVEVQEAFAETFEQYLKDGKAPTPRLQAIFDKFKQWLSEIYKSMPTGERSNINPKIQSVFDKMLSVKPDQRKPATISSRVKRN